MTTEIKLVALDVDGTLVGKDLTISPRARAAVRAARERGVRFIIVTGRMYRASAPYAAELGLDGLPLVAYNGAMVREFPSGRPIAHEPVPLEVCRTLAEYCEDRGLHVQAYVNDELFVPDLGPETQHYVSIARVNATSVGKLSRWLTEPSTKMLIIDEPRRIAGEIQAEVETLLGRTARAAPSSPEFLEIVSKPVSKGAALAAVADSMGLRRDEVMAIGDGMNDMAMLAWAGTSFAVGHAPEALRKVATHVTSSGPSDAVAEALEKLGLA